MFELRIGWRVGRRAFSQGLLWVALLTPSCTEPFPFPHCSSGVSPGRFGEQLAAPEQSLARVEMCGKKFCLVFLCLVRPAKPPSPAVAGSGKHEGRLRRTQLPLSSCSQSPELGSSLQLSVEALWSSLPSATQAACGLCHERWQRILFANGKLRDEGHPLVCPESSLDQVHGVNASFGVRECEGGRVQVGLKPSPLSTFLSFLQQLSVPSRPQQLLSPLLCLQGVVCNLSSAVASRDPRVP